jgi:hypothetical protein
MFGYTKLNLAKIGYLHIIYCHIITYSHIYDHVVQIMVLVKKMISTKIQI